MMDMKHLSLLLGAALLAASCTFSFPGNIVRGNGTAAEKTFEVGEFNSVSLVGSLDVIFAQSDEDHSVVLHTDENLIDDYRIEVKGDVLVISTKPGVSVSPKALSYVSVSAPMLREASITGSGDLVFKGDLRVDGPLGFSVTGSGDIDAGAVACKQFAVKVSGSGDIDAGPVTAEDMSLTISGSGDIAMELSGAGDVSAKISGSGDITLLGSARSLNSRVSGSGDIHSNGLSLKK